MVYHSIRKSILFIAIFSIVACSKDKKEVESPTLEPTQEVSISYLKDLGSTSTTKIKDDAVVRGVVISDADSKNIEDNKTLFLQEGTGKAGIMIKFKTDHNFKLHDSLEIKIKDQQLSKIKETVILQDIPNDLVKKLGTGKIIPRVVSLSELQSNKTEWEGSLVSVKACELIADKGKYSINTKIRDIQKTISLATFETAVFIDKELPQDVRSIIGIVRLDDDETTLALRNTSEVLPLDYIIEDFTTWMHTTWDFNLAKEASALHTKYFNWQGDTKNGTIKQLPNKADIGFTKAEKIYPYMPKDSIASQLELYVKKYGALNGLKIVKITFAASKVVGDVRFMEQSVGNLEIPINVLPFNNGIDEVKIGVEIPIEPSEDTARPKGTYTYYKLASWTPSLKENGKFYTATFFVPSTEEELEAIGIKSMNKQLWLDSPSFRIVNLSSRKTIGISQKNEYRYIPILIDKVELGF